MTRYMTSAVVLLAIMSSLGAQQSPSATSNPDSQTNDCSQRSIPLTVVKNSNATWDWHSLTLTVGGKQVPMDSMLAAPQPPRVLILVDSSGSMHPGYGTRWATALRTAAFALDAAPLDSPVSLGTFDQHDYFGKFESRQEVARELLALNQKEAGHGTALYGALKDAATHLQPAQFGDAIFLVTDGGDNRSGDLQTKAQQILAAQGIRVFVFMVFDRDFKTPEEREGPELMNEVAKATGGAVFEEPWSKEWVGSDEAKRLMMHIRTMTRWPYVLQFKLDQPLQKTAKLKISPPDSRSLELAYPHEILPCFALSGKSR